MSDPTKEVIAALRRARAMRTPEDIAREDASTAHIRQLDESGQLSLEELRRGVLRARLVAHGETIDHPQFGVLSRMPGWTDGLFTNPAGSVFIFVNGLVDRALYDRLTADVSPDHASKLLRDLHASGQLNLADPSMCGVVAEAWANGEPGSSLCIGYENWLNLFEVNGFTYLGNPIVRPTEPVVVYRGCTHENRFRMSWSVEPHVARRFAFDRISSRPLGSVYMACVEPSDLLAYVDEGHEEYEWVVHPRGLSDANVRPFDAG